MNIIKKNLINESEYWNNFLYNGIQINKKGSKIKIKKQNKGKFTDYCGGKVTQECINRGKNSSSATIRKRATFADNARKWKHQEGGKVNRFYDGGITTQNKYPTYNELINNPEYGLVQDTFNGKLIYRQPGDPEKAKWFYASRAEEAPNQTVNWPIATSKQADNYDAKWFNYNQPATMNYISQEIDKLAKQDEITQRLKQAKQKEESLVEAVSPMPIIEKVKDLGADAVRLLQEGVYKVRDGAFNAYNTVANHLGFPNVQYGVSFEDAYRNSRKQGQKSFIWDYDLYSTDYSGTHHKQYEEDLKSGKVDRWYSLYPNFTYPELRMAKQEELDTYGITNEQTKNKNLIDNTLVQIPARGYDVNESLNAILGEYSATKEYKTAEELQQAIYKTYPFLEGAPVYFKEAINDGFYLNKPYVEYNEKELSKFLEENNIEFTPQLRKTLGDAGNNPYEGAKSKELNRNEYDLLLGYPMTKNQNYPIPSISYYRTGFSPYYFSNNWVEKSTPLLPSAVSSKILTYWKKLGEQEDYYVSLSEQLNDKAKQLSGLSDSEWAKISYEDFNKYVNKAKQKYPNLAKENPYYKERENFIATLYDSSGNLKEYWKQKGLYSNGESLYPQDINKLLANVSDKELDNFIKYGIIRSEDELDIYNLQPGNYLAYQGDQTSTDYYNQTYYDGKYHDIINKGLELLKKYNFIPDQDFNNVIPQIEDRNFINSSSFGRYTIGIPENKDFISVYDEFDIDPFGSGNVKSKFTVGKPFEYYTRFYRDGRPNIDELYRKFNLEESKKSLNNVKK